MKNSENHRFTAAIVVAGLAFVGTQGAIAGEKRALGSSQLVASLPALPGYPEGIAVHGNKAYVSGPAAFGVPGNALPSQILVYNILTGALEKTITVQGPPAPLRAISCIAFGSGNELYVLDEAQGVVKINVDNDQQSIYSAGFHPVYQSAYQPGPAVLLNDLAFDKKGNLYVTDSFQATIWRVPAGGGAPQVWFTDPRLDGVFGPNGIRVDETSQKVYISQTFDATFSGHVWTLPLVDTPLPGDLQLFHDFTPGAGPDGIAFGSSGKLYVALAGYSAISVLEPNGTESAVYTGPAQTANPSQPLPWVNPANIAFDNSGQRLLVTNHASLFPGDPTPFFAIFDVYVNDNEGRLFGNNGPTYQ